LLHRNHICLARGPKENGFRPAVDPLFRTAATIYGERVIGVVLSGGLDDGTEGLALIRQYGGVTVVQNPQEAVFPSMPASAVRNVPVNYVVGVRQMAPLLEKLTRAAVPERATMRKHNGKRDVAETGDNALETKELPGLPSGFICPECGGALWEAKSGNVLKFRCHVGHSYTADSLTAAQAERLESALWTALRALEESIALRRRMAHRYANANLRALSKEYRDQARDSEERAKLIRKLLLRGEASFEAPASVPRRGRNLRSNKDREAKMRPEPSAQRSERKQPRAK
jgi:two-component system chemotaxis response regulator CheB